MSDSTQTRLKWAANILVLLATLLGIIAATKNLPAAVQHYAALASALVSAAGGWCWKMLPPSERQAEPDGGGV